MRPRAERTGWIAEGWFLARPMNGTDAGGVHDPMDATATADPVTAPLTFEGSPASSDFRFTFQAPLRSVRVTEWRLPAITT